MSGVWGHERDRAAALGDGLPVPLPELRGAFHWKGEGQTEGLRQTGRDFGLQRIEGDGLLEERDALLGAANPAVKIEIALQKGIVSGGIDAPGAGEIGALLGLGPTGPSGPSPGIPRPSPNSQSINTVNPSPIFGTPLRPKIPVMPGKPRQPIQPLAFPSLAHEAAAVAFIICQVYPVS